MSIESEWSTSAYHYLHSGKPRSAHNASGILIMVSVRLARANQIRWSAVVKGHLLHVRIQLSENSLDMFGFYQHSWLPSENRKLDAGKAMEFSTSGSASGTES